MLITKNDLQNWMGLTFDSAIDDHVDMVLEAAQEVVAEMAGDGEFKRNFEGGDSATTKYYSGNDALTLPVDDIRVIDAVTLDGIALTENADYYALPMNDAVKTHLQLVQPETLIRSSSRAQVSIPRVWEKAQRNVVVTGKFGYSADDEDCPKAVKIAILKVASGMLRQNIGDATLKVVTSENLGDYSVSYADAQKVADDLGVGGYLAPFTRKAIAKPGAGVRTV